MHSEVCCPSGQILRHFRLFRGLSKTFRGSRFSIEAGPVGWSVGTHFLRLLQKKNNFGPRIRAQPQRAPKKALSWEGRKGIAR